MLEAIMGVIGAILILVGIILIYDARIITKKFFGFGDQNEASLGLKILGLFISVIGGMILYFI